MAAHATCITAPTRTRARRRAVSRWYLRHTGPSRPSRIAYDGVELVGHGTCWRIEAAWYGVEWCETEDYWWVYGGAIPDGHPLVVSDPEHAVRELRRLGHLPGTAA
jgi:hypothetical protein